MICNIRTNFLTFALIKLVVANTGPNLGEGDLLASSKDHLMVTDKQMFPYVVAILKMASYLSAGAMISDSWILTAADPLFLVRESIREIRVRIGSINYKKGGLLLPIKYFRIHPYFDDRTPIYDLAMCRLSQPVSWTPLMKPIHVNLRRASKEINTTHFTVTAWALHSKDQLSNSNTNYILTEAIQRNRLLMVREMYPTNAKECRVEQKNLGIRNNSVLLCLDPNRETKRCERAAGAPVVKNGVLWGILSSWKREDCNLRPGPSFVNLVSSPNVSLWIKAVMRDLHWGLMQATVNENRSPTYIINQFQSKSLGPPILRLRLN